MPKEKRFYKFIHFEAMSKETSFTFHDSPKPERPRERLQRFGSEALSTQELLIWNI